MLSSSSSSFVSVAVAVVHTVFVVVLVVDLHALRPLSAQRLRSIPFLLNFFSLLRACLFISPQPPHSFS